MHRVLIPLQTVRRDDITIDDPRDVHHLVRVLRVSANDPLECFDGTGFVYRGRIVRCSPKALTVAIEQRFEVPPPHPRVVLAHALIQPQRFEWLIQKATELGVAQIIPVVTARTTVRPEGGSSRLIRWRRIAQEAARQSGRTTVPLLDPPQPMASVLALAKRIECVLMPTLAEGASPLRTLLAGLSAFKEVAVLIGPEGDFAPEEVARAKACGAQPVSLGSLTLRSETAALATVALIQLVSAER